MDQNVPPLQPFLSLQTCQRQWSSSEEEWLPTQSDALKCREAQVRGRFKSLSTRDTLLQFALLFPFLLDDASRLLV